MSVAATITVPRVNLKYPKTLPDRIIQAMRNIKVPFGPVGLVTYKRTYSRHMGDDDNAPKEEYWQSIARCLQGLLDINGALTLRELECAAEYFILLRMNFSGRQLWQLGTETVQRCGGDSLQACWHIRVDEPIHPFAFNFEQLMLGGGVGFTIMPEDVYSLPAVKHSIRVERVESFDCDFIIPDNREGWVEFLKKILEGFFFTGRSITYNTKCIRPRGQRIKSFGGTASGPEDLVLGINEICKILTRRHGQKLTPVDAMDMQNILAMVVVAGNVRRSAQIACGSGRDRDFLLAKYWDDGSNIIPKWRQQSNNTVIEHDLSNLLPEFWWPYEKVNVDGSAKGECYGLFNKPLAANYGRLIDGPRPGYNSRVCGPNPCVPGDTWVHTSEGPRQIHDLVGRPFQAVVDGKKYNSTKEGFWSSGTKEVFRVETDRGYSFECTEDHKILRYAQDPRDQRKKTLKELFVGDSICLNNHRSFQSWPGQGTYDEGWLLGSLLGDGSFYDDETAKLSYWGEDKFVQRDYAKALLNSSLPSRRDKADDSSDQDHRHISSSKLAQLAKDYGIERIKVLDHRIERKSYQFYRGFLRGWFDADGSVQNTTTKGITVRLHSSTLENLETAQRMLLRLGILSTIYKNRRPAQYREMPNGQGGTAVYWCKAQHDLCISCDNLDVFSQTVGFHEPAKAEKLERLLKSRRKIFKKPYKAKIVSIKSVGFKEVYDCTLPQLHIFDGNGVKLGQCGEIALESDEACNLAELYLTNLQDEMQFHVAATLMYKITKIVSTLPFLHPRTNEVVSRNHRLGIGVTGVAAAHHLRKAEIFDRVYKHLRKEDKEYSVILGVEESIALTTVKPSGTSAKLPIGCTPGANDAYANPQILRITFDSDSPMLPTLKKAGHRFEPKLNLDGSTDLNSTMVLFPIKYPDGTPSEGDTTAIEQLERVKFLQTWWSDNAVSATIQFKQEEIPEIKDWMFKNYEHGLKSISFSRHTGHGFVQPPNEPMTLEEYYAYSSLIEPIDSFADDRDDTPIQGIECIGDRCGVK